MHSPPLQGTVHPSASPDEANGKVPSPPTTHCPSEASSTVAKTSAGSTSWRKKVAEYNAKREKRNAQNLKAGSEVVHTPPVSTLPETNTSAVAESAPPGSLSVTADLQKRWESHFAADATRARFAKEAEQWTAKPILQPTVTRSALSANDGAVQTTSISWDNTNLFRGSGGGLNGGTIGTAPMSPMEMRNRAKSELPESEGGYKDRGRQNCRKMAPGWFREQKRLERTADAYLLETVGDPTVPTENVALEDAWPLVAEYGQGSDRPDGISDETFQLLTDARDFLTKKKMLTSSEYFKNRPHLSMYPSWAAANEDGYGTEFALEHKEAIESGQTLVLTREQKKALGPELASLSPSRPMTEDEKNRLYSEMAISEGTGPLRGALKGKTEIRLAGTYDDLRLQLKTADALDTFDEDEPFVGQFCTIPSKKGETSKDITLMSWQALEESDTYGILSKYPTFWDVEAAAEEETVQTGMGTIGTWCDAMRQFKENHVSVFVPTQKDYDEHRKSRMSSRQKYQSKMPGCTEASCSRVTCAAHGEYGTIRGNYANVGRVLQHKWTMEEIDAQQDANPTTVAEDGTLQGFVAHRGVKGLDGQPIVATTRGEPGYVELREEKAGRIANWGQRTRGSTLTTTAPSKTQTEIPDAMSGAMSALTDRWDLRRANATPTLNTGVSVQERKKMFPNAGLDSMDNTAPFSMATSIPITA